MSIRDDVRRYVLQKYVIRRLTDENRALQADIADAARELYELTGTRQLAATDPALGRVGVVSVRVTPARRGLRVTDGDALLAYMAENGMAEERTQVVPTRDPEEVLDAAAEAGELLPGCEWVDEPEGVAGVTARPDRKVLDAAWDEGALAPGTRELIEGGTTE